MMVILYYTKSGTSIFVLVFLSLLVLVNKTEAFL